MSGERIRGRGFTSRAPGLVNVLINEIYISEACSDEGQLASLPKQRCNCIWDTGATNTVIEKPIIDALGLKPMGKATVKTVGPGGTVSEYEANTYLVNIYLPDQAVIAGVAASEGSIEGAGVLIGMDIVGMGDFAVTNCDGKTTWTFCIPSIKEIDFVREVQNYNLKFGLLTPDEKRINRNKRKRERRQSR